MVKLSDLEALKLIKKAGIAIPNTILTKNLFQAQRAAKKIGWPVVLKISSPNIVHKTEVGGIAIVSNEKELIKKYNKILKNVKKKVPKAAICGILVQEYCSGIEMIAGAKQDPQFGPVLAFGTGGIFVEILKDITFRIIPVERNDVKQMISEIKGYALLKGARGQKKANLKALENCLLKLSKFVSKRRIKELDINPLFVSEKGVIAADVRIII
jgi:acyl-CoA synthetase (NDP forming)